MTTTKKTLTATSALLIALGMSACGDSSSPAATTTSAAPATSSSSDASAASSASSDATSATSAATSASSSASATSTAEAGVFNNPNPLPTAIKPGTDLKFGKTAIVRQTADSSKDPLGKKGAVYYQMRIDSITKGDQQYLEDLSSKGDFAGGSVWYIKGHIKVLAVTGTAQKEAETSVTPGVAGVDNKGDSMGYIVSYTGSKGTGGECDGFTIAEPKIGDEADVCEVALAQKGRTGVGVAYISEQHSFVDTGFSKDPYYKSPVFWMK